jgi:ubiquinone/menaquinone biosynthesis C-methylase UbiE
MKRARDARCRVSFVKEDACSMKTVPSGHFDWVLATFLCCVIPKELQHQVLKQFSRVLKPGGRFRLLEMVYSDNPALKKRQDFFTPFVEKVYGARFDRETMKCVKEAENLEINKTYFLKHDIYLIIEGTREK